MHISMTGRTAIVTGGSLGLGQAMATAFYAAGANVAIFARRQGPLNEALAAMQDAEPTFGDATDGRKAIAVSCDVSNADAIRDAHDRVVKELGPVDIVVNNAGHAATAPFAEISDQDWQDDLDLKLFAAIRLTRLVWPGMIERRWGRVINLLNTLAKAPGPGSAPTSVSRAAGMALTKVLSAEGAPANVLVNALLIGMIKSDQVRRWHEASDGKQNLEDFVATMGARLPMGRMGEPEECANLALFLASDAGSYVTGCAINMDGGLSKVM